MLLKISLAAKMHHPYIPQIQALVTLDNEILLEAWGRATRREADDRNVARGVYYRGQDLQELHDTIERMIEALEKRGFEWDGKNFNPTGAQQLTLTALRRRLGQILKTREKIAETGIKA